MSTKQTVLITGGTGIIGQAVIPKLIENGFDVVYTSRSNESVIDGAHCVSVDLLEEQGVSTLIGELKKQNIFVQHLINNFRNVDNLSTNENAEPNTQQWGREYEAAVIVPYQLSQELMKTGNLKSVVNITSVYGITAANLNLYDGDQKAAPIHYNVAKSAEIHLTKELAIRLANKNIRVNAVAYGGVKGRTDTDFEKKYEELCPYQGMLEKSDIFGALLFLISDNMSSKITGQTLQVDGGWTLW